VTGRHMMGKTLDRYALALAATEPLRQSRDAVLRQCIGAGRLAVEVQLRGRNPCDPHTWTSSETARGACAAYTDAAMHTLRSFGFSPHEWNVLSTRLREDWRLRQRVLRQARLYGLAATLDVRRRDTLVQDTHAATARQLLVPESGDDLEIFAAVAQKVEVLRQRQRTALVSAFHARAFPDYPICDSELLPLMARPVRRTCAAFPAQAANLIERNGIEFEAFEALLDKAERNILYRWKLARAIRRLKKRQKAQQALLA